MTLPQSALVWNETEAKINLANYFNLYPDIKLYMDVPTDYGYSAEKGIFRTYTQIYDVSDCATDIRVKTFLKGTCGQISFKLIHKDCQKLFPNGTRVRLYLDGRCWFWGFVFIRNFSGQNDMQVTAFDFLRYFKSPLSYMKSQLKTQNGTMGLTASDIFQKICTDLAIPCNIVSPASVPVPPQNYDMKTGFNIMDFAIAQTLINSSAENREYFTYYHETNLPQDEGVQNLQDTELFKTGGQLQFQLRNNLTVDVPITDELLVNYKYESSIDKQSYNEVILYKDQKTYLSKTGKTLKNGKKTGTRIVKTASNDILKGKWGYLPYYHRCPDSYTEAQMQNVAEQLQDILGRETQGIELTCYGIIGLKAGYLVGVSIQDIGGTSIGEQTTDEQTGETKLLPVYRTIQQCEMMVQHPLKMNITISSASYGEYDL